MSEHRIKVEWLRSEILMILLWFAALFIFSMVIAGQFHAAAKRMDGSLERMEQLAEAMEAEVGR